MTEAPPDLAQAWREFRAAFDWAKDRHARWMDAVEYQFARGNAAGESSELATLTAELEAARFEWRRARYIYNNTLMFHERHGDSFQFNGGWLRPVDVVTWAEDADRPDTTRQMGDDVGEASWRLAKGRMV